MACIRRHRTGAITETPEEWNGTNVRERNARAAPVQWQFTAQDARGKLASLYPPVST